MGSVIRAPRRTNGLAEDMESLLRIGIGSDHAGLIEVAVRVARNEAHVSFMSVLRPYLIEDRH
jgi:hypothetical protein